MSSSIHLCDVCRDEETQMTPIEYASNVIDEYREPELIGLIHNQFFDQGWELGIEGVFSMDNEMPTGNNVTDTRSWLLGFVCGTYARVNDADTPFCFDMNAPGHQQDAS